MSLNSPSLESEPPAPPPTLDSVLGKLGNPGKYQVEIIKIQNCDENSVSRGFFVKFDTLCFELPHSIESSLYSRHCRSLSAM